MIFHPMLKWNLKTFTQLQHTWYYDKWFERFLCKKKQIRHMIIVLLFLNTKIELKLSYNDRMYLWRPSLMNWLLDVVFMYTSKILTKLLRIYKSTAYYLTNRNSILTNCEMWSNTSNEKRGTIFSSLYVIYYGRFSITYSMIWPRNNF